MTTESLLVLIPISMPDQFDIEPKYVALFLCVTSLIVFPITYLVSNLAKKYSERKIILYLIIFSTISCALMIDLPSITVSLGRFIIFYTILFVSCNILESVDSALLAQIFPKTLNFGLCNSGFTIILTITGGRLIGSLLITLFGGIFFSYVYDALIAFYLALFALLTVLIYYKYSDLRVKAIARIIQREDIDK
jgi:MFS family permease